jgi:uncharacterized protein (DUF58 family)
VLTRRGWAVGVGALVLLAAGRLLGIYELFILAAGAVGLLGAGAVVVLARPVDLDAGRVLRPTRVHAGGDSRVELTVRNRGRRTSPVVTVRDSVTPSSPTAGGGRRREARFLVAPLRPRHEDRASYRLPAERRGTYRVGPLEAQAVDAFGLWSKVRPIAPVVDLTVYPAVEPLAPVPHTRGDDPTAGAPRPAAVGNAGQDLYGLRPYQVGDDLRRVHWPSTARTGDLMVRQLELPWQGRATVLVDVRAPVHTDATFEAAVSAAASIVVASWRAGALVRLTTSDGADSGFAAGHAHFEALMEHLAVVGPGRRGGLEPVLANLRRVGNGGSLAVVTTTTAPVTDLDRVAGLQGRFDNLTVVVVERPGTGGSRGSQQSGRGPGVAHRAGATLIRVPADRAIGPAWDRTVGGRR